MKISRTGLTLSAGLFAALAFLLPTSPVYGSGEGCRSCGQDRETEPGPGLGGPVEVYSRPTGRERRSDSRTAAGVEPELVPGEASEVIEAVPPAPAAIIAEGDRLRYRDGGNLIEAEGNVRIGYGTALLTADRAMIYLDRKEAYAEGNVVLVQGDNVITSDKIRYDFVTEEGIMAPGAGYYEPWFGRSEIVESEGREKVTFYDGYASTCDAEVPHYRLKAGKLIVYPDDKLIAHNVTFYVGKVPVLWLPYFRRSLKDDCRGFFIYPGYRNRWGFFFLSGYHWCVPGIETIVHLDYRYRRGWAYGLSGEFFPGAKGRGEWLSYYLHDRGYETPAGEKETAERYVLEYSYRQPLPYQIGSTLSLSYASDPTVRKDFFRREYDADSQPRSYLFFDRRWESLTLSLEVQPRLNDFLTTTERLPEVKLQVQESRIGESDFYYQGQNSYAWLTRKFPGISSSVYQAGRFDTFHQLSYSRKLFGWLNVLPSTSIRYNHYTRGPPRYPPEEPELSGTNGEPAPDPESDGEEMPEPEPGPTPELPEERDIWRRVFSSGLGLSTDIYGVFPTRVDCLEIDRLRHVITPSVNYVYTDNPTEDYRDLYQFDGIDRIERENFFRLSLRNRLQTKRGPTDAQTSWTLVDLDLSTPLFTRPERDNNDRLIGDISSRLRLTPNPRAGLNLDLLYDSYDNRIKRNTLDIWVRQDDWRVNLSHSYRFDRNRNQLAAEVYLRLNPLWAFKVYGRYDTLEDRFEEESLTIYRDLHCWTSSLEFRRRDEEDEYTFFLAFWIKDFHHFPIRLSN